MNNSNFLSYNYNEMKLFYLTLTHDMPNSEDHPVNKSATGVIFGILTEQNCQLVAWRHKTEAYLYRISTIMGKVTSIFY